MKFGLIYKNWIFFEDKGLIWDWRNKFDGRDISKNCMLCSKFYLEKQVDIKKWQQKIKLELIINYKPGEYELTYYPKVSIILAVYNGEKTIKYAIKSILKQTYKNIELIVVDDFSSDKTEEIVKKYKIKYFKNTENRGAYYSRNFGIKNATGDIVAIQDADDISDKNRILKSVESLIKNDVEFVLGNGRNMKLLNNDIWPIKVTMATLLCNKNFFDKYGYYDENTRHSGDLEILDRAYFMRFGEYKFKNFWYWLNYTTIEHNFYYHIYDDVYYIGQDGDRITKKNKIGKRIKYLNDRRKYFMNKINGKIGTKI